MICQNLFLFTQFKHHCWFELVLCYNIYQHNFVQNFISIIEHQTYIYYLLKINNIKKNLRFMNKFILIQFYYEHVETKESFGYYFKFFGLIRKKLQIFFMVNYYYPLFQTSLCFVSSLIGIVFIFDQNPYNSKIEFNILLISEFSFSIILLIAVLFSIISQLYIMLIIKKKQPLENIKDDQRQDKINQLDKLQINQKQQNNRNLVQLNYQYYLINYSYIFYISQF
ncbi:unnamed protein product [Paramecium pentaurelia]|uniref:Transmembrane protein n=1 Tax=Paramecium pentaurelia TaxID=43138 RepID=A0A8S1YLA3_9CILI|nr:unnamed protein product [Paramecium pentaurelia]